MNVGFVSAFCIFFGRGLAGFDDTSMSYSYALYKTAFNSLPLGPRSKGVVKNVWSNLVWRTTNSCKIRKWKFCNFLLAPFRIHRNLFPY